MSRDPEDMDPIGQFSIHIRIDMDRKGPFCMHVVPRWRPA